MTQRVCAIVVAHDAAAFVGRTLDALSAQTVPVTTVLVDTGSSDATLEVARRCPIDLIVRAGSGHTFGSAVTAALDGGAIEVADDDWLWLLHDDSVPEPDALAQLMAQIERSPSVALAGPKQVDAIDPRMIAEFGLTMTRSGERISPAAGELDQAQFDTSSDVLAVGTAGMLVRAGVWRALGGLDPRLAWTDDGLDFGIRARLAGHRVVVVPEARVRHRRRDARQRGHRRAAQRNRFRLVRWAQLYRRLSYAGAGWWPLLWLGLPLLAVWSTIGHALRKAPQLIIPEWAACLSLFVDPGAIRAHRATIASTRTTSWSVIEPLLVSRRQLARLKADQREDARLVPDVAETVQAGTPFWRTFAPIVCLVLALASVGLWWRLLNATAIVGGSMQPVAATIGDLWSTAVSMAPLDSSGMDVGADPVSWLVAVLGTITFWAPSVSIVALVVLAVPLAFCCGWYLVSRCSTATWARITGGLVWALAPVFLTSLRDGDLAAVLAHLVVPVLAGAAIRAGTRGVGRSRVTGLVALSGLLEALLWVLSPLAAVIAGIAVAVWLLARSQTRRVLWVFPVPLFCTVAGTVVDAVRTGVWGGLVADPWIAATSQRSVWEVLLGAPDAAALDSFVSGFWSQAPSWTGLFAGAITILLALGALGSFATRRWRAGAAGLAVFAAASVVAVGVQRFGLLLGPQDQVTSLSVAPTISLGFAGLIAAAAIGAERLRLRPLAVCATAACLALGFSGWAVAVATGDTAVREVDGLQSPAIVQAAGRTDTDFRVLRITALPNGVLRTTVVGAQGETLAAGNRIANADLVMTDERVTFAGQIANFVSFSGYDPTQMLGDRDIRFVLLQASEGQPPDSLVSTLDGNAALQAAGSTPYGVLWQVDDATGDGQAAGETPRWWLIVAQWAFLALFAIMAFPTRRTDADTRSPMFGGDGSDDAAEL